MYSTMRTIRTIIFQRKSNKYYILRECVFAALGIKCEMRMRRIVICGLSGFAVFFHIIL